MRETNQKKHVQLEQIVIVYDQMSIRLLRKQTVIWKLIQLLFYLYIKAYFTFSLLQRAN